ncbi:hypothetical protein [Flavobacterium saccharophilum]|uniref:Uncharacterized protein n=1 Tax=Flavobacterium saccharophilum TaxID=29534 RepID=A0A1M7CTD7_9FLAO|nr:hypothetical protein [Flavobacterium saccharophilum]SHL70485.1 hypothetical protein SAMN05444366_1273 [Flavobacterium saccharophilum]
MAQQGARISTDRFGNPYQLIGCKDKKGSGFSQGYIELGGKLYKIEPSPASKEGVEYWVKVTLVKKRPTAGSM